MSSRGKELRQITLCGCANQASPPPQRPSSNNEKQNKIQSPVWLSAAGMQAHHPPVSFLLSDLPKSQRNPTEGLGSLLTAGLSVDVCRHLYLTTSSLLEKRRRRSEGGPHEKSTIEAKHRRGGKGRGGRRGRCRQGLRPGGCMVAGLRSSLICVICLLISSCDRDEALEQREYRDEDPPARDRTLAGAGLCMSVVIREIAEKHGLSLSEHGARIHVRARKHEHAHTRGARTHTRRAHTHTHTHTHTHIYTHTHSHTHTAFQGFNECASSIASEAVVPSIPL